MPKAPRLFQNGLLQMAAFLSFLKQCKCIFNITVGRAAQGQQN